MAYRSIGAVKKNAGSGNITSIGLPAGQLAGDILVCCIAKADNVAGSVNQSYTSKLLQNGSTHIRLEVWWKRSTGAGEVAPTFTNAGTDSAVAFILAFSGCIGSGDPFSNAVAQGNAGTVTVTAPTMTPGGGEDCIAICAGGENVGNTGGAPITVGAFSGSNPTYTERADNEESTGVNEAQIGIDTGVSNGTSTGSRTATISPGGYTAAQIDNIGAQLSLLLGTAGPTQIFFPLLPKLEAFRKPGYPLPGILIPVTVVITTTPVSATLDYPWEATQDLVQSGVDPLEGQQALVTTALDPWEAVQVISQAGADVYEATQGLATTALDPWEATQGLIVTTSDPYEAVQGITQSGGADAWEAVQAITQTGNADPYEATQGLATSTADPYEATGGVATTAADPWEALQTLVQTFSDPWEAQLGLATSASDPWEALQGIAQTASDPWEADGNVLVSTTASFPIEALGGLAQSGANPFEGLQALATTASDPWEVTQSLVKTASDAWETAQGLVTSSSSPYEAVSQVAQSGLANPWEATQQVIVAVSDPYEGVQGVAVVAIDSWEALAGLVKTLQHAWEAIGGLSQVTLIFPWESTTQPAVGFHVGLFDVPRVPSTSQSTDDPAETSFGAVVIKGTSSSPRAGSFD